MSPSSACLPTHRIPSSRHLFSKANNRQVLSQEIQVSQVEDQIVVAFGSLVHQVTPCQVPLKGKPPVNQPCPIPGAPTRFCCLFLKHKMTTKALRRVQNTKGREENKQTKDKVSPLKQGAVKETCSWKLKIWLLNTS